MKKVIASKFIGLQDYVSMEVVEKIAQDFSDEKHYKSINDFIAHMEGQEVELVEVNLKVNVEHKDLGTVIKIDVEAEAETDIKKEELNYIMNDFVHNVMMLVKVM